jgi:hypothetical protein
MLAKMIALSHSRVSMIVTATEATVTGRVRVFGGGGEGEIRFFSDSGAADVATVEEEGTGAEAEGSAEGSFKMYLANSTPLSWLQFWMTKDWFCASLWRCTTAFFKSRMQDRYDSFNLTEVVRGRGKGESTL